MIRFVRVGVGLVAGFLGLGQTEVVDKVIGALGVGASALELLPEADKLLVPIVRSAVRSLELYSSHESNELDAESLRAVEEALSARLGSENRSALLGAAFRGEKQFYEAVISDWGLVSEFSWDEAGYLRSLVAAVHVGVEALAQTPAVVGVASMQALRAIENAIPTPRAIRVTIAAELDRVVRRPVRLIAGARPRLASQFVDRPYSRSIITQLSAAESGRVCALWGLRGVGKSQLASAFAMTCEAEAWSFVAWVSVTDRAGVLRQLSAIAVELGVCTPDAAQDAAVHALMSWLNDDSADSRLLVYDNVDTFDIVAGLIPRGVNSRTIITTTQHPPAELNPIEVAGYPPAVAVEQLQLMTKREDDGHAANICQLLGHLPVAVTQAASTITRADLTFSQYERLLRSRTLDETLTRDAGSPYEQHVATALGFAIDTGLDSLASRPGVAAAAGRLLDAMSVLSAHGLPRAWAATISNDVLEGRLATGALVDSSLLTVSADGSAVSLHRILAQVIRERNVRTRRMSRAAVIAAYLLSSSLLIANGMESLFDRRRHVSQLADHLAVITTQDSSEALSRQPELLTFVTQVTHAASAMSDPHVVIRLLPLIERHVSFYGADAQSSLEVINNLAFAYESAGFSSEAAEIYSDQLQQERRLFGDKDPRTLLTQHNLAGSLESLGEREIAVDLFTRTLEARRDVLGEDHEDTLTTLNDLGYTMAAMGDVAQAIAILQECVVATERALGKEHAYTLRARNNLMQAQLQSGQHGDAIALASEVLADRTDALGPDHVDTITSINNLAHAYSHAGEVEEAGEWYERAVAQSSEKLGVEHPLSLRLRRNAAHFEAGRGDLERAVKLIEEVVQFSDPRHPDTLEDRIVLGGMLAGQAGVDAAVENLEQALSEVIDDAGSGGGDAARITHAIIDIYVSHERESDGLDFARRHLAQAIDARGEADLLTLAARSNLAQRLMAAGVPCEASAHLGIIVDALDEVFDADESVASPFRAAKEAADKACRDSERSS